MDADKNLMFEFDNHNSLLRREYIDIIVKSLNISADEIKNVRPLDSGMTNRSFIFTCEENDYIFRVPGEGTDKLINRKHEYDVYQVIRDKGICDDIIYINPENGYKITRFVKKSHKCNPNDINDVKRCIEFLKKFHNKFTVGHYFDVFKEIERYESLLDCPPAYTDYYELKEKIFSLKSYIDAQQKDCCLSHIDSVCDNFLLTDDRVYLIDWEYAAMQDPHIDIAMFAIYAMYNREEIDRLIDIYFENHCTHDIRIKIYCYIAVCGFLWAVWCEYKAQLGVLFEEYSASQYRYAEDYYRIFVEEKR